MYKLIQVKYRNNHEGLVDDFTLNDLIMSNKIRQFYRESESRWVDLDYDWIRTKANGYRGPERREFLKNKQEQKPDGLLSRFFKRKTTEKPFTAQDWFEQGLALLYNKADHYEAIRAFTLSIQLDPSDARTYLNRGMAYEQINDEQQAFEDYSKAIQLLPQNAKAYYMRGILLWRYRKYSASIADLKTSADLGYKFAIDFLTQKGIARSSISQR
jgi:tetratricopeptide (TPR) repeat protein